MESPESGGPAALCSYPAVLALVTGPGCGHSKAGPTEKLGLLIFYVSKTK